jgi:hypothetical protein
MFVRFRQYREDHLNFVIFRVISWIAAFRG